MKLIYHRINKFQDLKNVPSTAGVEIDIRYHHDDLILHHDPFDHHKSKVYTLEHFLENWRHTGPIILNLKTEGIEQQCISLMQKYNIQEWFFLDMSMPFFAKIANNLKTNNLNANNLAVRFSEYEPIEYALSFKNKAAWIWVDCFNNLPLNEENYDAIRQANFKICIVSPELQNHSEDRIKEFRVLLGDMKIDAVCTKRPELWIG